MTFAAAIAVLILAAEEPKPLVTVVVRPSPHAPTQTELDAARTDVELKLAELPNASLPTAPPPALPQERIAAARRAYVNADFSRCLTELSDDAALTASIAQHDTATAARLLLWRVACNVGANQPEPARQAADQMAVFELQVPAEVGSVSPEVEAVIAAALKRGSHQPRVPLTIHGTPDAELELDGRATGCTAPCTVDVLEGNHVVRASADGHEPGVRTVRVAKPTADVEVLLAAAAPELAAAQWSARFRQSNDIDGTRSMTLLSTALRASRLMLLTMDESTPGKLQAVLAVDGQINARAERIGTGSGELSKVIDDLLVRGNVVAPSPPIYKRVLFWVGIAVAAAVAAGITAVVLTRQVDTSVTFR